MVALLLASGAMLALPVALKGLIDRGMAVGNADTINIYFVLFLGAAVLFGGFAALRFYLVTWLGERVVADLRSAVYRNVIRMDPQFFEVTRTGEVLSRLTTDTTLVQSISGVGLSIALRSSINLVGSLVLLAITNLKLLSLIVVAMPVVIVPVIALGRRLRSLSRRSQDTVADTSGLAGETLNAIQTVQAFTLEKLNAGRYDRSVETAFDVAVIRTRARAWLTALSTVLVFGAITLVLWFGAHQVLAGTMTGGELGQFLLLAVYAGVAAASLSEMWSEVQRAAGAMERLVELQSATPAIVAPERPVALPMVTAGKAAGRVSIDPALAAQVSPQDIVFIYANAAEGPRLPLAIIRTTVDKLPYDFILDDSLAMNPQMKLSQVTSVMVRARISKTGNAMPQPGDFGASVGPVTPGSADELKLNISKAFQ